MRFLVLILLLALTQAAFARNKENNKHITVLSYNIHYSLGMDDKYDLERIAQVILDSKAGIVGLQEIGDSTMAANLGELTGMNVVFGSSKENRKGYGDAILSKYPFQWIGNYSIPSASSSRYQVMGVIVDLSEIYGEETQIKFINTHFDWLESIGSQEARLAAVDVIERGFFENNPLPSILTGDFNCTPSSAPVKKLKKKGWVNKEGGEALFTIPVDKPERQIDYVLVRPKKAWNIVDVKVINEQVASDHLPVVLTLELKK